MSDVHDNYEAIASDKHLSGAAATAIETLSGELVTSVTHADSQVCVVFTSRDGNMRLVRVVQSDHSPTWRLIDNLVIPAIAQDKEPSTVPYVRPGPRTTDQYTRRARLERAQRAADASIRRLERELELTRRESQGYAQLIEELDNDQDGES